METVLVASEIACCITGIVSCVCLMVRPVREKVIGLGKIREGNLCLLRSEMLHIYYKHRDNRQIRQYEYENFILIYSSYRALGGNSFIKKIHQEVMEWEVVS